MLFGKLESWVRNLLALLTVTRIYPGRNKVENKPSNKLSF